jgi:hypothetical protein
MAGIVLAGPPQLYVQWACRRCGFTGGVAKTTLPLNVAEFTEPMMQELLATLRRKLVRKHQRQGCIAVPDDFRIERFVPNGKTLLDSL